MTPTLDHLVVVCAAEKLMALSSPEPENSYRPINTAHKRKYDTECPFTFKTGIFEKLYPRGTVVKYNKKKYQIVSGLKRGMVDIRADDRKKYRADVKVLKPILKKDDRILMQDPHSSLELRLAIIDDVSRGCIKARWAEFDGKPVDNTMLQKAGALCRYVKYGTSDLTQLPSVLVRQPLKDNTYVEGTVYPLLKNNGVDE